MQNTNTHMFKIRPFILNIHTEPPPRMDYLLSSCGNWNFSWLNPNEFDTKISSANMTASDIRPGFKLKTQENRHFPVTILTAIINVLCVACRILPGSNAPFCFRLSDSDVDFDVVQHSSSRELPRATASLGLNTCDPEAVQLDLAMNLDQSQSPLPSTAVVNANY